MTLACREGALKVAGSTRQWTPHINFVLARKSSSDDRPLRILCGLGVSKAGV